MNIYVLEKGKLPRILVLPADATLSDLAQAISGAVPVASVPTRFPRGTMAVRVIEGGGMEWVTMRMEKESSCC